MKLILLVMYSTLLCLACQVHETHNSSKNEDPLPTNSGIVEERKPLYITPKLQGLGVFSEKDEEEKLIKLMAKLEPSGAKGKVQVGYDINITLLELYKKSAQGWELNLNGLRQHLAVASRLGRPIVISLHGNHFYAAETGTLADELSQDPTNLMAYAGNVSALDTYFTTRIIPFTLSSNPEIPVNKYRFKALAAAIHEILQWQQLNLVGVALNGETHQLFQDLQNGVIRFKDIAVTDYSRLAQAEFREYLQKNNWSLKRFQEEFQFPFTQWSDLEMPFETSKTAKDWQFFNTYALGLLPLFGWVYHPQGIKSVQIYLNGNHFGNATLGLNRLGVFENEPTFNTPNVGFRFELDYSKFVTGIYPLVIYVELSNGKLILLNQQNLVIQNNYGREVIPQKIHALADKLTIDDHFKGQFDKLNLEQIRYNPLAKLWQNFREEQSIELIKTLAKIALAHGIHKDKLFSYQLQPWRYGNWNAMMFAISAEFFAIEELNPGITMYGGDTLCMETLPKYGVPEFNPTMNLSVEKFLAALRCHYQHGAVYISPFYLELSPPEYYNNNIHEEGETFDKFLISPNSDRTGTQNFYQSILQFAAE